MTLFVRLPALLVVALCTRSTLTDQDRSATASFGNPQLVLSR
jgi:hypothetical protein